MLVEVVVVMWETKRRARETFAASSGCSGGKLKVTISKKKRSKSNISTMCGCVVNVTGTQTRAGKCDGYAGVRVGVHAIVPFKYPYPSGGLTGYVTLVLKKKSM